MATAFAAAGSGVWGKAIEVPGTAALNTGGYAEVYSVSCASAGNCAAGGRYAAGGWAHFQAFVVSEKSGVWGKAIEVPGTAALNTSGYASVYSVSCAAGGACAAGGSYDDSSYNWHAFVVSRRSGVWGKAVEVPGMAALNTSDYARVGSVSCASAGNCVAVGAYDDGSSSQQAFIVSQKNWVWGKAIEVPGTAALNAGGYAEVTSVSCASAGNCAAGGYFSASQAFVVNEKNGVWGNAIEVPGTAALNTGGFAMVRSVSCASAGNCAAGGVYTDASENEHAFVVSEKSGVWGKAIEVPGLAALNTGGLAMVNSVSCVSTGTCVAGGSYSGHAFVVRQTTRGWGRAVTVRGTAGVLNSLSCASTGNCTAGGTYADRVRLHRSHAFIVSQTSGVWGNAVEVPGVTALGPTGYNQVSSVSCAKSVLRFKCAAGGYYSDGSGRRQAFVTKP